MNSSQTPKKKISEYTIEDLKEFFSEIFKKISSKIILLEFGNDFLNIALAKSQNKKLYIKKVLRVSLPEEALDKSIPSDPRNFGNFLKQIFDENKINTNRIALSLPSDACYTRLIDIPSDIEEDNSVSFIENTNSDFQIPISLENSDFEIKLTYLPKKEIKNKIYNNYFLTSLPKKNVDNILDSFKNADLEICSLQMSHMCIANLLKTEIEQLKENELIISVDLLDEFSQFVVFDKSGPLLINRLASIRNYPSIAEMKEINNSSSHNNKNETNKKNKNNYHPLSKLDLKVLIKEINESFSNFLIQNNINKKGKIYLSGRNSQHKNLVEIIGKSLKMDVAVISPINNYLLKEFTYNPDEINYFSMSRLIGLGLSLIKDNELDDESLNREFLYKKFSYRENIQENSNKSDSNNNLNQDKIKTKEKSETKSKNDVKKKELPPLPNKKIKDNKNTKSEFEKNENKTDKTKDDNPISKNRSFKMDKSFLKND